NDPAELDDQKLKKSKVEMFGSEFYPRAPLLTIADDLLLALKEGLISQLNLISSYKRGGTGVDNNPGKEKKFANSFESNKFFNDQSKILVVPDYKSTEYLQAPNIYHVKQEVSDLKDEDFTKAAEEYKEKTKTSNNK
ncbi:42_t:CDS:2, partial [Paraglomus occultum]